jgi:hypothetical protein
LDPYVAGLNEKEKRGRKKREGKMETGVETGRFFNNGDRVAWGHDRKGKIVGLQKDVQYLVETEGKFYWVKDEELTQIRKPNLFDLVDEELTVKIPVSVPVSRNNEITLADLFRNFVNSFKSHHA